MLTQMEYRNFRTDVDRLLEPLKEKYNANIKTGQITYSDNSFRLVLEVQQKEVNGKSFEQAEFERFCVVAGLKKEDYNREFGYRGNTYQIVGIKPKSYTYPIVGKNVADGKIYKFTIDSVKNILR